MRRKVGVVFVLSLSISFLESAIASASPEPPDRFLASEEDSLQIYYTSPVLVRAGDTVRIPVDAVCVAEQAPTCDATVSLAANERSGSSPKSSARAMSGLHFDLTAVAARAAEDSRSGSVGFSLRARDASGHSISLPPQGTSGSLRFYVTRDLRRVHLPAIPFGRVTSGKTVLFLPWGSGSSKAGLSLGSESATVGPSSFDVDVRGRVYLLDALQTRLAVFQGHRLLRETSLPVHPDSDVTVEADGTAHVLSRSSDSRSLEVLTIDRTGLVAGPPVPVTGSIPSQIRISPQGVFAHVLPLDAWVPVHTAGQEARGQGRVSFGVSVGRPVEHGRQLLSVMRADALRLGVVAKESVTHAVEISGESRLGEVALAESDGSGGYFAVIRTWRESPAPADQFQFVHVSGGRVVETFSIESDDFADSMPLSKFRLGRDGGLYVMSSSPEGLRIARYRIGGE